MVDLKCFKIWLQHSKIQMFKDVWNRECIKSDTPIKYVIGQDYQTVIKILG